MGSTACADSAATISGTVLLCPHHQHRARAVRCAQLRSESGSRRLRVVQGHLHAVRIGSGLRGLLRAPVTSGIGSPQRRIRQHLRQSLRTRATGCAERRIARIVGAFFGMAHHDESDRIGIHRIA